jgi:hypothetical protein
MLKKGIYVLSKKAMVSTRWRKLENLQQPIKQRPARGLNTKDRRSGKAKWSMTHIDAFHFRIKFPWLLFARRF